MAISSSTDATPTQATEDPKTSMEQHARDLKARQSQERKDAKAAAAAKVAPKSAGTSKAVKVSTTPKASGKKTPKAPTPTKADAVRALLDQGRSVRQVSQELSEQGVTWSYAWDVAAAYEKRLGAPGKFIASRAPGWYVPPAKEAKAPVAKKAPLAIDATPNAGRKARTPKEA